MDKDKITLVLIKFEQKQIVWKILQDYLQELSQFGRQKKNEKGEYPYQYFDSYWEDNKRYPFFIMIDNEIAGFIFVNNHSVLSEDNNLHAIGEFYILPKFRKIGIGKEAAFQIFNQFSGKWEVSQLNGNLQAIEFWRKVINEFTKDRYKEINNSLGPVQTFISNDK